MSQQPLDPGAELPPGSLPTPQPHKSTPRKVTLFIIIVLTVLWALMLLPAGSFALLSPMAFDSGSSVEAWTVFYILIAAPCVLLISIALMWIMFAIKRYVPAILAGLLPFVGFVSVVVYFALAG